MSAVGRHFYDDALEVEEGGACPSAWTSLFGAVYDITPYLFLHPGGGRLLIDKAGRDMSEDFTVAHGPGNGHVLAILAPFRVGELARPPFADLAVAQLYTAWCGWLATAVQCVHMFVVEWRTCVDATAGGCAAAVTALAPALPYLLLSRLVAPLLSTAATLCRMIEEVATPQQAAACDHVTAGEGFGRDPSALAWLCASVAATAGKPCAIGEWCVPDPAAPPALTPAAAASAHAALCAAVHRICDGLAVIEGMTDTEFVDDADAPPCTAPLAAVVHDVVALFRAGAR